MPETANQECVGILLAGGTGTRMQPLTKHLNKHLIPVYMRPMIEYSLGTLLNMGLRNILIVTGREHMGQIVQELGSGADYGFGVDFTFKVQEQAGGIAEALGLAENFAAGRRIAVMLGDNVFDDDDIYQVTQKCCKTDPPYAANFLAEVSNPKAYGVASVKGDKILKIVEKPEHPESNLVVTGLYLYPSDVFQKVKNLTPSARGELEITDINNFYIQENKLHYHIVKNWFDAGEPEPWIQTQIYVAEHPHRFSKERFQLRES